MFFLFVRSPSLLCLVVLHDPLPNSHTIASIRITLRHNISTQEGAIGLEQGCNVHTDVEDVADDGRVGAAFARVCCG